MKVNSKIYPVLLFGLLLPLLFSCKKEVLPTVTITTVTNITDNSATSGGEIISDGGAGVTARGVCWSTSQNPTTTDSKTTNGTGTGSFTSSITGLTPGATYNIRAYAINSVGTAYSSQISFSTLALAPLLITTDVSAVTSSSVNSGGNITNESGSSVTARGVCWSTTQNPTVADNKTTDGSGSGIFISAITGLTPGTTYYIRAYATNSIGTSYGNQVTATTIAVLPTITTTAISVITATTAMSGGNITNDGGSPVTARGVCWSTSQTPSISDSKTTNGTGSGSFTSSVTELVPGTTYYVRAYATNSVGTAYGTQVSFKTSEFKLAIFDLRQETEWDYWIVAKDGSNFYVNVNNQKPVSTYYKPNKTLNGYSVFFDDRGLPSRMVIDNNIFLFDNLRDNLMDVSLILSTGEIKIFRDIQSDITLNEFNLNNFQTVKNDDWTLYALKMTSHLIGVTSCVAGLLATSTVVGAPVGALLLIGCASTVVGLVAEVLPEDFKFLGLTASSLGGISGVIDCILGQDLLSCAKTAAEATLSLEKEALIYLNNENVLVAQNLLKLPTVITTAVSSITSTTATSGGNITSNGGATVTARGVCWSTSQNPTTANDKTSDGTDKGSFTSYLTDLDDNTTYYVRAYATNSAGTAYGLPQISFKTLQNVSTPTVTTTAVTTYTTTSATVGGNVTASGGTTVTERGVYWGTSQNPQTTGTKLQIGSGTGLFSTSLSGLNPNTTYYIKAYAINSAGTAFGTQVSFTTGSVSPVVPTLTTTAVSSITSTTATSGGNISSDGGAAVTAKGVCWSTTSNPTTALTTKTTDGTGTGSFTSSITGLTANTTYYVRAYATNSAGTAYGNQISFTSTSISYGSVSDVDGNTYSTVTIGTQEWMGENLMTTKYNDGTAIPNVTNNKTWAGLTTGAYCWYNNNAATSYGALYNWYTVNTGKLCPTGWHVPTDAEWHTLILYLDANAVLDNTSESFTAGGKLKETGTSHWYSPNTGATNETGFAALPGGYRYSGDGAFDPIGDSGLWWSSTEYSTTYAWYRRMLYYFSDVYRDSYYKQCGLSVRCVRD